MSAADDDEDSTDQKVALPTGPKTLGLGVLAFLDKVADGTRSLSIELLRVHLDATKSTATDRNRRAYDALRQYLLTTWVEAPNGVKYKLTTLQRKYLHHQLTLRYRAAGNTWEAAWQNAAEYVSIEKTVPTSTVKDHYTDIQNLLKQKCMRKFCRGLEYEFQIAVYGDKKLPTGTFLHPEFLRGTPDEQAGK